MGNDMEATVCPFSLSADVSEMQVDDEGGTLIARKVGEAVQNTLGAVVTAMDIPLGRPGSTAWAVLCGSRGLLGSKKAQKHFHVCGLMLIPGTHAPFHCEG